jgi:DNA repair protein RadC
MDSELHKGHRAKIRQRFRDAKGLTGFAPHEIIEFLLFYSIPRQNTNEIAHKLIRKFGNFSAVLDANFEALIEAGLTENSAALIKLIPAVIPVYYSAKTVGEVYDNCEKLKDLFMYQYPGACEEQFRIACFDNNLHLINNHVYLTGVGISTKTDVNFRKITEIIIRNEAYFIAVSHNHLTHLPHPSPDDIAVTRQLCRVLRAIGVTLLDHIIVGKSAGFSMKESNIIGVFD